MAYDSDARRDAARAQRKAEDAGWKAEHAKGIGENASKEARKAQDDVNQLRRDFAAALKRIEALEAQLAPKKLDKSQRPSLQ